MHIYIVFKFHIKTLLHPKIIKLRMSINHLGKKENSFKHCHIYEEKKERNVNCHFDYE